MAFTGSDGIWITSYASGQADHAPYNGTFYLSTLSTTRWIATRGPLYGNSFNAGNVVDFGVTVTSAGAARFYQRGILDLATSVTFEAPPPTVDWAFGRSSNTSYCFQSNSFLAIGYWPRVLSDGEMREISLRPWQLFRPVTDRAIFLPTRAAGGGATIAVPVGAIITEGAAPSVTTTAHKTVAPALGSAVIEGLNPAIEVSVANAVQPNVGTVHAEGKAPDLIVSLTAQPAQGAIVVEGAAPLLRSDIIVPLGAAVVAGFEPLVSVGLPQRVRPASDIAANGWLPSSGSDLYAMLDEETPDDDDYIYSPTNPSTETFEVKFASAVDPVLHSGHEIAVRLQAVNEDTAFDLYLMQGTDVLDSWTEDVLLTDNATTRTHVLSEAMAAAITDYSDLRLRGTARAPSG
jgi:hypothetical protein